jgi:hypothetical protein
MWDALLEVRIRMQRMLLEANKLPQVETLVNALTPSSSKSASGDDSSCNLKASSERTGLAVKDLFGKLLDLQVSYLPVRCDG